MDGQKLVLGAAGLLAVAAAVAQRSGSAASYKDPNEGSRSTEAFPFTEADLRNEDTFRRRLHWLYHNEQLARLEEIKAEMDQIRQTEEQQRYAGMEHVWHGAPHRPHCMKHCVQGCPVEAIRTHGFALVPGKRTSFTFGMADEEEVENHAIFLAYDKPTAEIWGRNRSPTGHDYEVFEVYADVSPLLDLRDIRKVPSFLKKKIKESGGVGYELLDDASFVALVRNAGYNGVRFREDPDSIRDLGSDPKKFADTLAVFDPQRLHLYRPTSNEFILNYFRKKLK
jgi:hypothetical protein